MRVAVFGATGGTGLQVVQQALEKGMNVTALVRNPAKLPIHHSALHVVQGNVLDLGAVEEAIQGADGVICCLGRRPFKDPGVMINGTRNIIAAMKKFGLRRIVLETSYLAGGSYHLAAWPLRSIGKMLLHWTLKEKNVQEADLAASGLEWVVVRPPALRDGARTGKYRAGEDLRLQMGAWINRADVAEFMLRQLTENEWLRKAPTVTT